jgi:hypothetical protein
MCQQRALFGWRSRIVARIFLAAIMLAGIIPLAVGQDQKDTSKDKELSVTVQGPRLVLIKSPVNARNSGDVVTQTIK